VDTTLNLAASCFFYPADKARFSWMSLVTLIKNYAMSIYTMLKHHLEIESRSYRP